MQLRYNIPSRRQQRSPPLVREQAVLGCEARARDLCKQRRFGFVCVYVCTVVFDALVAAGQQVVGAILRPPHVVVPDVPGTYAVWHHSRAYHRGCKATVAGSTLPGVWLPCKQVVVLIVRMFRIPDGQPNRVWLWIFRGRGKHCCSPTVLTAGTNCSCRQSNTPARRTSDACSVQPPPADQVLRNGMPVCVRAFECTSCRWRGSSEPSSSRTRLTYRCLSGGGRKRGFFPFNVAYSNSKTDGM